MPSMSWPVSVKAFLSFFCFFFPFLYFFFFQIVSLWFAKTPADREINNIAKPEKWSLVPTSAVTVFIHYESTNQTVSVSARDLSLVPNHPGA
jgi:hypothetical protein